MLHLGLTHTSVLMGGNMKNWTRVIYNVEQVCYRSQCTYTVGLGESHKPSVNITSFYCPLVDTVGH